MSPSRPATALNLTPVAGSPVAGVAVNVAPPLVLDVEPPAAEAVEPRRVHPVGLDHRVRRQAGRRRPRRAEPDGEHRRDAARRPHEAAAVGRGGDRAALVDAARLGALEPVRAAVGGERDVAVAGRSASAKLPARTMTAGFSSAKSRRVVEVKPGRVNIIAGTASRVVCRKPPMSPSALTSGAPVGGLTRSSTAVSSRPAAIGRMVIWPPASQLRQVGGAVDGRAGAVHHPVGVERVDLHRLGHPAQLRASPRAAAGSAPNVSHGAAEMSIV